MTRLYSIGDVHEMTGLSVSALRYYADMKVVCPVRIDRQTGYRYYDFDDIQRLKTVGYLKKAGFSLAEITVVMEAASEEERRLLMSERMEQTEASERTNVYDGVVDEPEPCTGGGARELQDPSEADGFSKSLDDRNGEAM